MKQQHKPKAAGRFGPLLFGRTYGVTSCTKSTQEGTQSWTRSWHGGILSLPGFGGPRPFAKSIETTTLFVKRTTWWSVSSLSRPSLVFDVRQPTLLNAAMRCSQFSKSCRVNFHANGLGVRLLRSSYSAQTQANGVQSREIVRREHLPLDNRKVNLDLVQPAPAWTGVCTRLIRLSRRRIRTTDV